MRPRKPWFRKSTDSWYVEIDGKQRLLAKGKGSKAEAEAAFYRIMAAGGMIPANDNGLNVATLCDLFLDFSQRHNKPETYKWHKHFLTLFCQQCGRLVCAAIKPFHLTQWLDSHKNWTGARRSAQAIVKRAFAWGKSQGLITADPIAHIRNPPITRRERVISADERTQILGAIKDKAFKKFLTALLDTGCRPSEVASVTAANVNVELGVWVLKQHKTAKKTGKPRIIYLSPDMLDLTKKQMAKHPTGPLFPNTRGKPFSRNAWRCRFRRLRERFANLQGVVCYSTRSTFATSALENGVGLAHVAELLGHTGTAMIMQHYSMIAANVTKMREAAAKAAG
jgi:integrase